MYNPLVYPTSTISKLSGDKENEQYYANWFHQLTIPIRSIHYELNILKICTIHYPSSTICELCENKENDQCCIN